MGKTVGGLVSSVEAEKVRKSREANIKMMCRRLTQGLKYRSACDVRIIITRNTFYGTRYLSHCRVQFCIKTFFL